MAKETAVFKTKQLGDGIVLYCCKYRLGALEGTFQKGGKKEGLKFCK